MARRKRGIKWLIAREAFAQAFRQRLSRDADIDIGYVSRVGEGLERDVFAAEIKAKCGSQNVRGDFAALLPRHDAPPEVGDRARREVKLLEKLRDLDLPFTIPSWSETVETPDGTVLVQEYVRGVPLDPRVLPHDRLPPWVVTGEIAAAIHSISTTDFRDVVPSFATRRTHVEASLCEIEGSAVDQVVGDAITCIRSHLPPNDPAAFLHGDLLGQNILVDFDGIRGVIDWEYSCIGDPAYDLAIVTRGARRPFHLQNGLKCLLEAYVTAGGAEVRLTEVRVHELLMHLSWHLESCRGEGRHPPSETRKHLRGVLSRAERSNAE